MPQLKATVSAISHLNQIITLFNCFCIDIKIFLGDDEDDDDHEDEQIEELVTEENQVEAQNINPRSNSVTGKYSDSVNYKQGNLLGAGALSSAAS